MDFAHVIATLSHQLDAEQRLILDWELLTDYLRLFKFESKLPELKSLYGQTQ